MTEEHMFDGPRMLLVLSCAVVLVAALLHIAGQVLSAMRKPETDDPSTQQLLDDLCRAKARARKQRKPEA